MATRRDLKFNSIDEIMPDVDRLLEGGHTTIGKWSLGQICNHMSSSIIWSIEGFPVMMPWIVRATIGKLIKGQILKSGKMKANIKIAQSMLPQPGLDARAEAEALRAAISIYKSNHDPRPLNPIFGKMTDEEITRLHCIHAAHHLSFALPNAG